MEVQKQISNMDPIRMPKWCQNQLQLVPAADQTTPPEHISNKFEKWIPNKTPNIVLNVFCRSRSKVSQGGPKEPPSHPPAPNLIQTNTTMVAKIMQTVICFYFYVFDVWVQRCPRMVPRALPGTLQDQISNQKRYQKQRP